MRLLTKGCMEQGALAEVILSLLQVAVRNNQQGVLYFTGSFKPEILAAAPAPALDDNFFVSSPPLFVPALFLLLPCAST